MKEAGAVVESAADAIRTACVEPNHRGLSRKKDGVSITLGCEWNVLNGFGFIIKAAVLAWSEAG